MSLEVKIEELTAAVLVLARAYSEHASAPSAAAPAAKRKAKPSLEAVDAAPAAASPETTASTPAAPAETTAEPQAEPVAAAAAAPASSEEADREQVRSRLVALQNSVSREKALELLDKIGEAKTIGKVPAKNFKKLIAACDAAIKAAEVATEL